MYNINPYVDNQPSKWRQHGPPTKRWYRTTILYSAAAQKGTNCILST